MSNKKQIRMDKMAMALQHAVHLMREERPNTLVLDLGIQLSTNILLPLMTELALKGLKQKETTSDGFTKKHDLLKLFQDVSSDAQSRVNERYQRYLSEDDETKDKNHDIRRFLEDHKDDFVEWRYLEDDKVGSLLPAYKEFQYAICAILDEVYEGDGVVQRSLSSS